MRDDMWGLHGPQPHGSRGRHGHIHDEQSEFEPGQRRGRGMSGGARIGRGDVRSAILLLLAEQPSHGYQLIQRVSERSGGIWQPSPGSVYPALQMLEDEDFVRAEMQEGRRVFTLTPNGRHYVEEHQAELDAIWQSVAGTVDEGAVEMRELVHQLGSAVRQVMHAGSPDQVRQARELLVTTRRQLYRILADDASADDPSSGNSL